MDRSFGWLFVFLGITPGMILMGTCTGCARREQKTAEVDLATLPYLQQTHDPELQAELARLLAEQATPQLLEVSEYGAPPKSSHVSRDTGLLGEMNELVDPQALRLSLQRMSRFYPDHALRMGGVDLQKAREMLSQFRPQLATYRTLWNREGSEIHIALTKGLMADLTILDHACLAHRLEGLAAADTLYAGHLESAFVPLRYMLCIDARLAAVKHAAARLTAARLRGESLHVVAAIVQHPQCTLRLQRELLAMLQSQLDAWPSDAGAWIGDRALGLHAYEMVRSGQLLSILTEKEIEELQKHKDLEAFVSAVMMSVDDDERFYLDAMRRVVRSCSSPYYQRISVMNEINDQAEALADTPRFPLFATRVLLGNLAAGQRAQALDRARCEAWVIALRTAVGNPVEPMWTNPITGKPYELTRDYDAIHVKGILGKSGEESVTVPAPLSENDHS